MIFTFNEVKVVFEKYSTEYMLGTGYPRNTEKLNVKFIDDGGLLISLISPTYRTGNYNVDIRIRSTILSGARIFNNVRIGMGCLVYYNIVITNGC